MRSLIAVLLLATPALAGESQVTDVPRGVKHKAIGKLTVLTVCIPRGVLHDVHEVE